MIRKIKPGPKVGDIMQNTVGEWRMKILEINKEGKSFRGICVFRGNSSIHKGSEWRQEPFHFYRPYIES